MIAVIALLLAGTAQVDAVTLAERACIRSLGDFASFDAIMASEGSRTEADVSSFANRTVGQVSAYRVDGAMVTLVELPAGRFVIPGPVQLPDGSRPTLDMDLPHVVVCRVVAPAMNQDLAARIAGWTIGGRASEPIGGGTSSEKGLWRFGPTVFVAVSAPNARSRQLDVSFSKSP